MKARALGIPGAFLIDLDMHGDARGFFMESYHCERYFDCGIKVDFVQDNRSFSQKGVLRGLHYQVTRPIGHLIHVARGRVFDVGVDLRCGSPSFGKHIAFELSEKRPQQLYFPPGVAHGFCTLENENEIHYKCSEYYYPDDEGGVLWSDPDIGIKWPLENPLIKQRDAEFPLLRNLTADKLPKV